VAEHLPTPGDVRIKATVRFQQFSGSHTDVWLGHSELTMFVEQLRSLVDSRQGTAKLEAISQDEFSQEVRSMDPLGHFEASVRLGRHQYSGTTCWPTMISGGFEIEPSQLQSILTAFQALLVPRDATETLASRNEINMNEKVKIELSRNEALVLFDFLSRFSDKEELIIEDQAEKRILWDLCCLLEKQLVQPFHDDYDDLLKFVRDDVRDIDTNESV